MLSYTSMMVKQAHMTMHNCYIFLWKNINRTIAYHAHTDNWKYQICLLQTPYLVCHPFNK